MPFVIFACALGAFAFGLSEFVVIGLAPSLGASFSASPEDVGQTVTWYALGVALGGALLTALTSSLSRKRLLVGALVLFSLAHVYMTFAPALWMVVAARFISGLTHGVFLAAASAVAAQIVGQQRAGKAVAFVFSGLTIALVFGVPVGAYLGEHMSWRVVILSIAVFALLGAITLGLRVPNEAGVRSQVSLSQRFTLLFKREILGVLIVTVLTYTSLFTLYTYIAAFLTQITHVTETFVSLALLVFGVAAVIGNLFGGWLRDKLGSLSASGYVVAALVIIAFSIMATMKNAYAMVALIGGLGFVAFAAVAVFQSRVIEVAQQVAPHSGDVASGLNIAGFNLGIVLGSLIGAYLISSWGIEHLPLCSAVIALASFVILNLQRSLSNKSSNESLRSES